MNSADFGCKEEGKKVKKSGEEDEEEKMKSFPKEIKIFQLLLRSLDSQTCY